jgi:hypothetical protein
MGKETMQGQSETVRKKGGRPRKTDAQRAADAAARKAAPPPPVPLSATYYTETQMQKMIGCSSRTWQRMKAAGIAPKTTYITPYRQVVWHPDYEAWLAAGGAGQQRRDTEAA